MIKQSSKDRRIGRQELEIARIEGVIVKVDERRAALGAQLAVAQAELAYREAAPVALEQPVLEPDAAPDVVPVVVPVTGSISYPRRTA